MIKKILPILTIFTASFAVNAQNVNIPDANFKAYLVGNSSINSNGDTEIQVSEASSYNGVINCSSLNIADLSGIETFSSASDLFCESNSLTNLNLTGTNFTIVKCPANQITNLILGSNSNLEELWCAANNITSINTANNSNLKVLYAAHNSLTALDVNSNNLLETLEFDFNLIPNIDLSNNNSLIFFSASSNPLTSIDFSNNGNLEYVELNTTSILEINISNNVNVNEVECHSNASLNSLNVANGNNNNFITFSSQGSPNLTCIQVDDATYSTTNWTDIDATASFSTNCSLGLNETTFNNLKVYPNPAQNKLSIELEGQQITEINILDLSGKVVKVIASDSNAIDVSALTEGVYILKVSTETGIATSRFVKQ